MPSAISHIVVSVPEDIVLWDNELLKYNLETPEPSSLIPNIKPGVCESGFDANTAPWAVAVLGAPTTSAPW